MDSQDPVTCVGCGENFHSAYVNTHYKTCSEYVEKSKEFPHVCRKGCGLGFNFPRSRANHERICSGRIEVLKTCPLCGDRTESLTVHRASCVGPREEVPLPEPLLNLSEGQCPCGWEGSALSFHQDRCPLWFNLRKGFEFACEGCGLRFETANSKRAHTNSCLLWKTWSSEKKTLENKTPCPSCGRLMKSLQFGLHVNSCPGSWTDSDWENWRNRDVLYCPELYEEGKVLGEDYVKCAICGGRFRKLSVHLSSKHDVTSEQYLRSYFGKSICGETHKKCINTCISKYGVSHPMKVSSISQRADKARIRTMMERYGAPTSMEAGLTHHKKNRLEELIDCWTPARVVYTGDHKYWINVKDSSGKYKPRNPDFVVYDEELFKKILAGTPVNEVRTKYIVEVLGEYWHLKRDGLERESYIKERLAEYASVGIQCLIIWESEIKGSPEAVKERLEEFIDSI